MKKLQLSDDDVYRLVERLLFKIEPLITAGQIDSLYPVPMGGFPIAIRLQQRLNAHLRIVEKPTNSSLIIDDLTDSGATRARFPDNKFACLFNKGDRTKDVISANQNDGWLVFPWESNNGGLEQNIVRILEAYGYDPKEDGLIDTPKRVVKVFDELLVAEEPRIAIFDSKGYDQMITEKDIQYYSLCEHHMLPFFGTTKVSYIPDKKIIGLSKLSRIVSYFSKRLNTQEYLTENISNYLMEKLQPLGVGVQINGRHMCKEMRGAKAKGTMVTTSLKGLFLKNPNVKSEFLGIK